MKKYIENEISISKVTSQCDRGVVQENRDTMIRHCAHYVMTEKNRMKKNKLKQSHGNQMEFCD